LAASPAAAQVALVAAPAGRGTVDGFDVEGKGVDGISVAYGGDTNKTGGTCDTSIDEVV
jgi:hypothetical protein